VDNPLENLEISPRDVQAMIARGEKFLFVDVREKWEHDVARIEGAILIPLRQIPPNVEKLSEAGKIVLLCHHGIRSMDAAVWLQSQGIQEAVSMSGGIDQWSREVDSSIPRY
jgi:rhodanese-related sulfurtransferase